MTDHEIDFPSLPAIFIRNKTHHIVKYKIGAFGLLLFAIAGFYIAVKSNTGPLQLHLITTLPIMGALALYFFASSKQNSPSQITVSDQALEIELNSQTKRFTWDQVGFAKIESTALSNQSQLILFDSSGYKFAKIIDDFPDFKILAELISYMISLKSDGTANNIRKKNNRKDALLFTCLGIFILFIGIGNMWLTYYEQHNKMLFDTQAVIGQATILRHFTAPDGHTRRLEYLVTTPDGLTGKHNAEVDPDVWDLLENQKTINVKYVPSKPNISRMVIGEIENPMWDVSPSIIYAISAFFGALGLSCLIIGILGLCGVDIQFVNTQWGSQS